MLYALWHQSRGKRDGGREREERKGGIVGREREGREWKEKREREEGWDGERSKRHVKQKFNKDQFKEHM